MSNTYPKQDAHGRPRTPYAVQCEGHLEDYPSCGLVYLTYEEYMRQLSAPNATWRCPICRAGADWDDDNYEESL